MPLSNLKQVFTDIRLEDVDLSKTSAMKVYFVYMDRGNPSQDCSELRKRQNNLILFDCNHLAHVIQFFFKCKSLKLFYVLLYSFLLNLRAISEYKPPGACGGAIYRRVFLRYEFGGLIFGAATKWRDLFSEFYGMSLFNKAVLSKYDFSDRRGPLIFSTDPSSRISSQPFYPLCIQLNLH